MAKSSTPSSVSGSARPVVLSIAGYDPSAGAGILADLKTFAAHDVYGMACITALTIQSTQGVRRIQAFEPSTVVETLDCLAEDASFSSIKVGMLGQHSVAAVVLDWLQRQTGVPVVLDPVLKSSSGKELLDAEGADILRGDWLARVNWITPNLPELAALTGTSIPLTEAETEDAARKLQQMAAQRGNAGLKIVVTGGHTKKPDDLLLTTTGCRWYRGEHIETTSTHGTGCAFSSALAARLALGDDDFSAVKSAKEYVAGALRHAYPVGQGNGPLNHFWRMADHGN
jgi:hydroxymethylpyrimidine/phosphomethylpyrimidine kinase